jgi:predicted ATP-dependent endonuclease of OLD family
MQLIEFGYSYSETLTIEPFPIGKKNLLIGKNGSGKSIILQKLLDLSSEIKTPLFVSKKVGLWDPENWKIAFKNKTDDLINYELHTAENQIVSENLRVNGINKIFRDKSVTTFQENITKAKIIIPNDSNKLTVNQHFGFEGDKKPVSSYVPALQDLKKLAQNIRAEYLNYYSDLDASEDDFINLLDDVAPSTDFEQAKIFADQIFDNPRFCNQQMIVTSNNPFFINAVSLDDITVCHRQEDKVICFNRYNSPQKFNDWKQLGLQNYDLLSTGYLLQP